MVFVHYWHSALKTLGFSNQSEHLHNNIWSFALVPEIAPVPERLKVYLAIASPFQPQLNLAFGEVTFGKLPRPKAGGWLPGKPSD